MEYLLSHGAGRSFSWKDHFGNWPYTRAYDALIHSWAYIQQNECLCPIKYMSKNIHSSLIYSSPSWEQSKCLSVVEWMRKLWYIQTVGYFKAMKKRLLLHTKWEYFHSHYVTWKKPDAKWYIVSVSVYMMFKKRQNTFMVREVKIVVTSGVSIAWEKYILYLDLDVGYICMYEHYIRIYKKTPSYTFMIFVLNVNLGYMSFKK